MPLTTGEPDLTELCDRFNARTSAVSAVTPAVPVLLLADFDDEPDAKKSEAVRLSPAAHSRKRSAILVNDNTFWKLSDPARLGVLAHEMGHAVCLNDALMGLARYSRLGECIVADLLACRWGFLEELSAERINSNGARYVEYLSLFQDEEEYLRQMRVWYVQKLASINLG